MTRVKTPGSGRQLNPHWMAAVRELTEAGCTRDDIAARLGIGTATVSRYRARLREQQNAPSPSSGGGAFWIGGDRSSAATRCSRQPSR